MPVPRSASGNLKRIAFMVECPDCARSYPRYRLIRDCISWPAPKSERRYERCADCACARHEQRFQARAEGRIAR